jgi:hypothetical protein
MNPASCTLAIKKHTQKPRDIRGGSSFASNVERYETRGIPG